MRLIDAEALKTRKSINSANFNTIETIQEWIDNAPTIDIVRCGECKWGEELAPELIYCDDLIGGVVKRTDFCSYGERRSDERT